jgi:DNA-binding transcriptional LysR family regulator
MAEHDCLTIYNRQGRSTWRLQGPHGSREVSINSRFAVIDMRVLMQACIAELGIALLPQLIAEPAIEQGTLVHVLPLPAREPLPRPAARLHEPPTGAARGSNLRRISFQKAERSDDLPQTEPYQPIMENPSP